MIIRVAEPIDLPLLRNDNLYNGRVHQSLITNHVRAFYAYCIAISWNDEKMCTGSVSSSRTKNPCITCALKTIVYNGAINL